MGYQLMIIQRLPKMAASLRSFPTVLGPLIIAFASIPGRGGLVVSWWKSLLANILVFPAVFSAFLFAGVILGSGTDFKQTLPLFAGINPQILKFLIGYGILMWTPS